MSDRLAEIRIGLDAAKRLYGVSQTISDFEYVIILLDSAERVAEAAEKAKASGWAEVDSLSKNGIYLTRETSALQDVLAAWRKAKEGEG